MQKKLLLMLLGILILIIAGCANNQPDRDERAANQVKSITVDELKKQLEAGTGEDTVIVDIREPLLYEKNHIPGAILIPFAEFQQKYTQLDKNKKIILSVIWGLWVRRPANS